MIHISSDEKDIVLEILRKHAAGRRALAFGSRIGSNSKPFSDLDIAIVGEGKMPLMDILNLIEAFKLSTLPFQVDVVDYARTAPNFQKIIDERHEDLWQN